MSRMSLTAAGWCLVALIGGEGAGAVPAAASAPAKAPGNPRIEARRLAESATLYHHMVRLASVRPKYETSDSLILGTCRDHERRRRIPKQRSACRITFIDDSAIAVHRDDKPDTAKARRQP